MEAEGESKFLAQLDADATRLRFPVAVLTDLTAADVDLSVRPGSPGYATRLPQLLIQEAA